MSQINRYGPTRTMYVYYLHPNQNTLSNKDRNIDNTADDSITDIKLYHLIGVFYISK